MWCIEVFNLVYTKRECTYSLYSYNQCLVVEHNLCVLPFNIIFNALWCFIETPYIKLIVKYWNIHYWGVFGIYIEIQLYFALDFIVYELVVLVFYLVGLNSLYVVVVVAVVLARVSVRCVLITRWFFSNLGRGPLGT